MPDTPADETGPRRAGSPHDGVLAAFRAAYDTVIERGWPVPVGAIRVDSAYGTTHVNACGPADGRPLVLIHGGGATAAVWYANVADLARTHRVYAIDRIGEPGRSVRGESPPRTPADLYAWLDATLDALGVDEAAFCGHSYGGWIALTYALHAPHRVSRLVLLDPSQCLTGFRPGYLLRSLPVLIRPTAARARALIDWETRGAAAGADTHWLHLYGLAAEFPDTKVIVGRRPKSARLRACAVPTRVILAADSRTHAPRAGAAAAARDLPGAETTVLEGVSHHGMPWQRADELNRQIIEFLAEP